MTAKRILPILALAAASALLAGLALAANQNPPPKKEHKKEISKITAVDAEAKTVTVYDPASKGDVTYTVNTFTKIVVNDKPGKIEDLKAGMKVDVSTSGNKTASKIEAGPAPVERDPKKKR